ncbi:hypothetical protein [Pedobacter glucosidilyticus]|uniref:hypothetical protein n=1 Tax=Pedobacter glucosidilyticus TaxID=1122941 RepID=UPI0026EF4066|nr:hypothetical protein [Pedobacter glucosidilyticus]
MENQNQNEFNEQTHGQPGERNGNQENENNPRVFEEAGEEDEDIGPVNENESILPEEYDEEAEEEFMEEDGEDLEEDELEDEDGSNKQPGI